MNVLVACEESQEVCKAFRARGHNAYSCDIQMCSGGHPEWHIMGDVRKIVKPEIHSFSIGSKYGIEFTTINGDLHFVHGNWDLIIAHPPCTYMSNAGACRMYPTKGNIDPVRFEKAMDAKEFFMFFYNLTGCPVIIENPRPLKCVGLPKEDQRIQPYQFGEPWSKLTYLWYRNTDWRVKPTEILTEYKPFLPSGTGRKLRGDSYGAKGCAHDGKARSKTFPGIAAAMAEQWG